MRDIDFANHEYYHIYNRGVDKRKIFLSKSDYFRFLHNLYEFNNEKSAIQFSRIPSGDADDLNVGGHVGSLASNIEEKSRRKLVDIICLCLMPNHYHLILEQLVDNGISKFMHKLGTGHAKAFNAKYKRTGALLEGTFKAIHIKSDTYITHLSRYIHLNPVELLEKNWKENGIKNWKKANEFLEDYRYSSYLDYIGKKNFPSITNRKLILEMLDNEEGYKKFVREWIVKDFSNIEDIILES